MSISVITGGTLSALTSYSESGRNIGLRRTTVAELVEWFGIEPKPIPDKARAKGLDTRDIDEILRRLGPKTVRQDDLTSTPSLSLVCPGPGE